MTGFAAVDFTVPVVGALLRPSSTGVEVFLIELSTELGTGAVLNKALDLMIQLRTLALHANRKVKMQTIAVIPTASRMSKRYFDTSITYK